MNDKPGIGHLRVGDEVIILVRQYRSAPLRIPAIITTQKRVWWEFEKKEVADGLSRKRTWRMRRDSQDEGHYNADRFATAEQLEHEDRCRAADEYLRDIQLETWKCRVIDKLTLANLIRTHLGLETF